MRIDSGAVLRAVDNMNKLRTAGGSNDIVERLIDDLLEFSQKLVVYGTLQPGRPNHHVLAPLGGSWSPCEVRGTLHDEGWGAVEGYPAIRLDPRAPSVAAMVLDSPRLPGAWERLDEFEGDEYRRVLTPLYDDGNIVGVANIYEARRA